MTAIPIHYIQRPRKPFRERFSPSARWMYWILPIIMIGSGLYLALPVPTCTLSAAYLQSGEYCYRARLTVTSLSTSALDDYPVRMPVQSKALVDGGFTKDGGWDLRPFNVSIQDTDIMAQSMTVNTQGWWIDVDAVASDGINSVNWSGWLYTGNPYIQRDQGISLLTADTVIVPDHADLDFTDDFQIDVTASKLVSTTQADVAWVDKYDAGNNSGYWFGYNNGTVVAKIGNGTSSENINVAWDGAQARFRMTYDNGASPKLKIEKYNSTTSSWDSVATGGVLGSVDANTETLKIGGGGYVGRIYEIILFDGVGTVNYARRAQWGFNPVEMIELTTSDPVYTGTILNMVDSANHSASYTFNRGQSLYSATMGPIMPIFASPAESVPEQFANVLGNPTQSNLFTTTELNTNMPFYTAFETSRVAMGIPSNAWWILVFGGASSFLAIAVYMATRRVEIAAVVPGAALLTASFMGLLAPWITMMYGIAALSVWMIGRWATE